MRFGQLVDLTKKAGWLPSAPLGTEGDLFAPLAGKVRDAVAFVQSIRNMAAHPGAYVRGLVWPDFDDVEHMRPTFAIFDGIATEVFERLTKQVNTLAQKT